MMTSAGMRRSMLFPLMFRGDYTYTAGRRDKDFWQGSAVPRLHRRPASDDTEGNSDLPWVTREAGAAPGLCIPAFSCLAWKPLIANAAPISPANNSRAAHRLVVPISIAVTSASKDAATAS